MSVYDSIMTGLNEALEDARATNKTLKRKTVTIIPVKNYDANSVKRIRNDIGFSQKLFANYIGVSKKTVEAWESGLNQPSGAASRLLNMMEMNHNLTKEFPFVSQK